MKRIALALACITAVSLAGAALAGEHAHADAAPAAGAAQLKEVSVDELVKLSADGKVSIFDANGAETRAKFGVIPGATLLASSSSYETSVLPADKTQLVVFYCANPRCTASDNAAGRAKAAGWTNVAVLRAGIKGWVDAGKATTTTEKASAGAKS